MTTPAPFGTACPNCGAAVRFLWAQAVQTTCAYCRSVLVRDDLDLTLVGKQADFPSTGSPIQIGTEGTWQGRSFLVVGRLAYQWDRGRWNEWHCRLTNGSSAWLSDAQLEYAMSVAVDPREALPSEQAARVGESFRFDNRVYQVATRTRARYLGTEGELPFESYTRESCIFVDLQTGDGHFATLDYSDAAPTLYVGEYCEFEQLALKQLREFEGWSR
ncbi:MAG: DUF4178 domain-containing protein [Gemmatimonadaceae bacterium]|nr:DUF4178 domain-containing protein [Gemmatimonadaceae bacterium]